NIICFSPDLHKFREETIEYIARHLPEFELITISGLSYRTYKELIADAKYMITFGEGLDGYFIETIFSGGISMAMYNSEFFTPDFRDVPGVFDPMEDFKLLVVRMIRGTLGTTAYEQIQRRQFEVCSKYYRLDLYSQNIRTFYEKKFNVQSRILADTNIKIDRT
ncbi:MAG TPA: hypothetical protein VEB86_11925, partial [Chryseosolibacter sp.]|nr:hypothetical protein [Chryseosolibacter sp.]